MYTLIRKCSFGGMVLLSVWLWASCSKSNSENAGSAAHVNTTMQPLQLMLDNNIAFSDFDTLMRISGYMDSLGKGHLYTLLVPDNTAFTNAGIRIDSLLALPKDSLKLFVGNHILAGVVTTSVVPQTITNPMVAVNGQTLYLSKPIINSGNSSTAGQVQQLQKTLHVNGIKVTLVDQMAVDGALQVLLFPLRLTVPSVGKYLLSRPEYSLFVAGLRKFNLFDQLDSAGPHTIFPPTNDMMISNGMTLDRINSDTFDVNHYQPFLFTAGLLQSRTFMTDFADAQLPNNNIGYTQYGTVQYSFGDYNPELGMEVSNYYSTAGPRNPNYNWIGPSVLSYEQNQQPALNGVIMPINNVLVYPDSVYLYR
jgi:uncharacterized surface protein with fasciclin (FAS1) repeats